MFDAEQPPAPSARRNAIATYHLSPIDHRLSRDNTGLHLSLTAAVVAIAALLLLFLMPGTAHGQSTSSALGARASAATTGASPLDSIARLAITRNLGVRQAREVEQQATLAVRQAQGLFLPTLGVDARYSELSGAIDLGDAINPAYAALNQVIGQQRFPTNIHQTLPYKQETKLKSVLPLFNGAMYANLAAARAIRDLRGAERAAATRKLDAEAREAYLNYASAVSVVEIRTAALAVLRENQRTTERLMSAGTITGDAVYRARAAVADGEQQLAESQRQSTAALGALNLLLDRELDTPVPAIDAAALPTMHPMSFADALAASQRREEREQAQAGLAASRAQGRAASSSFLPTVALAGEYGVQGKDYHFDTDHDAAMASVVMSWNFFNGGQDAMRREQSQSQQRAMTLKANEIDRMIALDVRVAYDAATVAEQSLTAATARRDAAQRAFTLVDKRFNEGLVSHLEWSDARLQLTAAEINLTVTRYGLAARVVEVERAAAMRRVER